MDLTEAHLRASYEIYVNYGNSSSATIMAVMNQLRNMGEGKENVVACAFGPGIALEMMILRRANNVESDDHAAGDGRTAENGHSNENGGTLDNGVAAENGHAATNRDETGNGHVVDQASGLHNTQELGSSLPIPEVD